MLDLWGWERFGEGVGDHVVGGAENEVNLAVVDYPADEVEAYVNVFCAHVVLVVFGECDSGLVV